MSWNQSGWIILYIYTWKNTTSCTWKWNFPWLAHLPYHVLCLMDAIHGVNAFVPPKWVSQWEWNWWEQPWNLGKWTTNPFKKTMYWLLNLMFCSSTLHPAITKTGSMHWLLNKHEWIFLHWNMIFPNFSIAMLVYIMLHHLKTSWMFKAHVIPLFLQVMLGQRSH